MLKMKKQLPLITSAPADISFLQKVTHLPGSLLKALGHAFLQGEKDQGKLQQQGGFHHSLNRRRSSTSQLHGFMTSQGTSGVISQDAGGCGCGLCTHI